MTYYSTSTLQQVGPPRGVFYAERWWDTRVDAPNRDAHLAAVGIVALDDSAVRPVDTDTHTHDRTVTLVAGVPTVVYVQRPWTQGELDAQQAQANRTIIDNAITAALVELDTLIAAPAVGAVPDGTMTTAQLSNVVRALRDAVQANRVGAQLIAATERKHIRYTRGDFDGIN